MSLSKNDENVLQSIITLDGKCMDSQRCKLCPFRVMCLPEFLNPTPPTSEQRAKMALDVITHHALVDEQEPLDIEQHRWDKK
jgi:hypothetical protein